MIEGVFFYRSIGIFQNLHDATDLNLSAKKWDGICWIWMYTDTRVIWLLLLFDSDVLFTISIVRSYILDILIINSLYSSTYSNINVFELPKFRLFATVLVVPYVGLILIFYQKRQQLHKNIQIILVLQITDWISSFIILSSILNLFWIFVCNPISILLAFLFQ